MKYLITGISGQLGYDLEKRLKQLGNCDILGVDQTNMDITNRDQVFKVIEDYKPDVVFHGAAYTAVDNAEDDEELCTKVNVEGTKNIADACKKQDSIMVYISSDYVFDGTKEGKYNVEDQINPIGIYGKTKFLGEEMVRNTLEKHFIIRTSWVFGINGKNFVKTMLNLAKTHEEVSVVADQIGSPTYTVDLAKLLVNMVETDFYGTYHATNEGDTSWADFARYIFISNGLKTKVNDLTTEEYPTKAKRPKNSKLSKHKLINSGFELLPTWQNAIDRYNEELKEGK